ncbi:iron chelate uptake ABC transporter family permease subunit [Simkania sp.]|uniref:metal ABC transporter permease n=1 Tax=Simkania sp. TaxID=34094 RepID=UPI003B5284DC
MNSLAFWQFFTDPILRVPTLGAMLMCLASSLIGVLAFVRRRSLLGEALVHATYPGVVVGILLASVFFQPSNPLAFFCVLFGAFLFAWLGLFCIGKLEKKLRLHPDAALCLVLSLFLGLGVTLASRVQMTHPVWYQQIQVFLFGQAATMGDQHIGIYALLSVCIMSFVIFRFRQIELMQFDREFMQSLGIPMKGCHILTSFLLILALVIGIRSVGVVLMSGMLIAPAAFARQWTERLGKMFIISGVVGTLSGFLGVYLSVKLPLLIDPEHPLSLPTGPIILLVAVMLTFLSLLFSPKRGWVSRALRIRSFRQQRQVDHVLKALWKRGTLSFKDLQHEMGVSNFSLSYLLYLIRKEGWAEGSRVVTLTHEGKRRGARLVRLHRLWELYLTSELKVCEDRVHFSAEEMEHILTPEIEESLTRVLKNPTQDPHHQPIPTREEI